MGKPSFNVVTSVLVVLAFFACVQLVMLRFMPPAASNHLVGSRQRFLSVASHEPINWHVLEEDPFAEARSAGKPILLVVGTSDGKAPDDVDETVFGDPDTARFVSQNFFCIRIDGHEHPEWLNAIRPITRLRTGFRSSFQAWTLDSQGHVLSAIRPAAPYGPFDNGPLSRAFSLAKSQFESLQNTGNHLAPIADEQREDIELLDDHGDSELPRFTAYTKSLAISRDLRHGGFPRAEVQALYPNAWRFCVLTGNVSLLKSSLDPLLLSPLMDLQYGGFFQLSESADIGRVQFDKSTPRNSEMMLTLALQGQISADPFYRRIAESTYDWLLSQATQNVMLAASQVDDENRQGRSPRFSFPTWRLRDILSAADSDWASVFLGLNPMHNRQMVPYLQTRATLVGPDATYDRVLGKLRAATSDQPEYSDTGYLDVNGHSVARMFEVARLWGDPKRLADALPLAASLGRFKTNYSLLHRFISKPVVRGYLGDYLGYSDAKLQEYLATGKLSAFQDGLKILTQAVSIFKGEQPGEYDLSDVPEDMGGFVNFCVPEIADNISESCSAQMIRLLLAYGRLTGDTVAGKALIQKAKETTAMFSDIAGSGGPLTAGYFCAAAEVSDDIYAVSTGPNARDLADQLYRRAPRRFVAPAAGSIRTDLQHRGPGIYIVGKTIEGPFSLEEASSLLPATLLTRTRR